MSEELSAKITAQIQKVGLPTTGDMRFEPLLTTNKHGEPIIQKTQVLYGPKRGKFGYADAQGRIWIKDYAHGDYPDHWDVQEDDGERYQRVDFQGNVLP